MRGPTSTATPTQTTTAPRGQGGDGRGPLDGISGEWVPYAGAGAAATAVALGALVRRFGAGGGGQSDSKRADVLDWGSGLDDDE